MPLDVSILNMLSLLSRQETVTNWIQLVPNVEQNGTGVVYRLTALVLEPGGFYISIK